VIRAATRSALGEALSPARAAGGRIGLVPTMGYLHEGHLALIDLARGSCDTVVVSVFVNPLQFGPGEDLDRYPRDLERDAGIAAQRGTDVLFVPTTDGMYPGGEVEVVVDAPRLADRLCGAFRPGHFRGVLTVVAKLLNIIAPHVAVFGRKDFQQLALIRRMVADLDMGVEIVSGPIVRESDGLAMSSRNVLLSQDERKQATLLSRGLEDARTAFDAGETTAAALIRTVRDRLDTGPLIRPQYIEVVTAGDMAPIETADRDSVLAVAAYVGTTRLIDNIVLGQDE
jgi:pantoate--beta-alanine ligase